MRQRQKGPWGLLTKSSGEATRLVLLGISDLLVFVQFIILRILL